jgi:biopolymer transport protein ExbB/TolQ
MIRFFNQGGPLFMGILTVLLFIIIGLSVYYLFIILAREYKDLDKLKSRFGFIRHTGVFSLVTGVLGQLIGLYMAFSTIESSQSVSPGILAGGLKVSLTTTIYGAIIFMISLIMYMLLKYLALRNKSV